MGWLRALVFVLATTVGWGGMLPVVARVLIGVDHVCHCRPSEHDCVCIRCQPDRVELWVTEESVKGQCGDDDAFPSAEGIRMIAPAPFAVRPAPRELLALLDREVPRIEPPLLTPPVPPPRARDAARSRLDSASLGV